MFNWKTLSAIGHSLALVVPAVLNALQGSQDPKLMLIAQVGASIFTLVNALYHSTPEAAPAPSAPATVADTSVRLPAPTLPPTSN